MSARVFPQMQPNDEEEDVDIIGSQEDGWGLAK